MVAAAVIGAGVLAAGATVYGSDQASSATSAAASSAAQVQREALAQQKELAQPYTDMGKQAIPTLESLLGIAPPGAPGSQAGPTPQQTLEQLPGYQFAKTQGVDATKAAAASMGMSLSGNTLEGVSQFTTGLADQTYGAEVQHLMGIAGLGQAAAAGQAANIGAGANNLSNIYSQQGANQAGIAANEAASISSIAGNLGSAYLMSNTLKNINTPGAGATAPATGMPYASPVVQPTTSDYVPPA